MTPDRELQAFHCTVLKAPTHSSRKISTRQPRSSALAFTETGAQSSIGIVGSFFIVPVSASSAGCWSGGRIYTLPARGNHASNARHAPGSGAAAGSYRSTGSPARRLAMPDLQPYLARDFAAFFAPVLTPFRAPFLPL